MVVLTGLAVDLLVGWAAGAFRDRVFQRPGTLRTLRLTCLRLRLPGGSRHRRADQGTGLSTGISSSATDDDWLVPVAAQPTRTTACCGGGPHGVDLPVHRDGIWRRCLRQDHRVPGEGSGCVAPLRRGWRWRLLGRQR